MGEESGAGHGTPPAALTAIVVRGKRSKRRRVHAGAAVIAAAEVEVIAVTTASAAGEVESSSSSVADGGGWRSVSGADEAASGCVTEEEEDMALCLMLLARGGQGSSRAGPSSSSSSVMVVAPDAAESTAGLAKDRKFRSRRPADGGEGEFVYECRTCGKCFPSFQALGGHRTSHKKPRLPLPPTTATATSEEKKLPPVAREKTPSPSSPSPESHATSAVDRTVLAIPVPATPPKQEGAATATGGSSKQQQGQQGRVHECSICGAEFGSGQALGGHMRRHRPLLPASASMSSADDVAAVLVIRKEKSLLELDLNMPAPCDDAAATEATSPGSFTFSVKERPSSAALLPFPAPASALVDCHY